MFKCEFCGTQTKPKESMTRFVTESRSATYPRREKANRGPEDTFKEDPGGEGFEIVKEKAACERCSEEMNMLAETAGAA